MQQGNIDELPKRIKIQLDHKHKFVPAVIKYIIIFNSCMHKEFVMEMGTKYPFGELGEIMSQETSISVCKKLHHSSEQEYELMQQMVHFLKIARHQNLVNIKQVFQTQTEMLLYYQYVPFRLEGWLLDVNEQLIGELQVQFLQLTEYLCRSSIKFAFDPNCVGVSVDMTLKYFLDQFVIDMQNAEQNLQVVQNKVREFFTNLKLVKNGGQEKIENSNIEKEDPKNNKKNIKNQEEEEQPKQKQRMQSISTNGSYSPNEDISQITSALSKLKVQNPVEKQTRGEMITAKYQSSKKKCNQLMQKFKRTNFK